jgi:hypothetical protein
MNMAGDRDDFDQLQCREVVVGRDKYQNNWYVLAFCFMSVILLWAFNAMDRDLYLHLIQHQGERLEALEKEVQQLKAGK